MSPFKHLVDEWTKAYIADAERLNIAIIGDVVKGLRLRLGLDGCLNKPWCACPDCAPRTGPFEIKQLAAYLDTKGLLNPPNRD